MKMKHLNFPVVTSLSLNYFKMTSCLLQIDSIAVRCGHLFAQEFGVNLCECVCCFQETILFVLFCVL